MTIEYISCADTAKLIRKSLREAFPDVRFSVQSRTYSGGASISVGWIDGPNPAMVESITRRFRGSYFDGSIDYKGSVFHMLNGKQVRMGADYVTSRREYSDDFMQKAIAQVYRKYRCNFTEAGLECPSVATFRAGQLGRVYLPRHGDWAVADHVNQALGRLSDRLAGKDSATSKGVFVTHDDGYSRQCGSGMSAVQV